MSVAGASILSKLTHSLFFLFVVNLDSEQYQSSLDLSPNQRKIDIDSNPIRIRTRISSREKGGYLLARGKHCEKLRLRFLVLRKTSIVQGRKNPLYCVNKGNR